MEVEETNRIGKKETKVVLEKPVKDLVNSLNKETNGNEAQKIKDKIESLIYSVVVKGRVAGFYQISTSDQPDVLKIKIDGKGYYFNASDGKSRY